LRQLSRCGMAIPLNCEFCSHGNTPTNHQ
jgi:hypothetical protein